MKTKVMLYESKDDDVSSLSKALTHAGIRVTTVKSLSRLHILLGCMHFDAIILTDACIRLYAFSPSKHLKNIHTYQTLLVYSCHEDGTTQIEKHCSRPETLRQNKQKENDEKVTYIESVLHSLQNDTNCHPDTMCELQTNDISNQVTSVLLPASIYTLLHKKMSLLLSTIAMAGSDGADIQSITDKLWRTNCINRKKDIQIYICKLRSILAQAYQSRYTIHLRNKHYILIDNAQNQLQA